MRSFLLVRVVDETMHPVSNNSPTDTLSAERRAGTAAGEEYLLARVSIKGCTEGAEMERVHGRRTDEKGQRKASRTRVPARLRGVRLLHPTVLQLPSAPGQMQGAAVG